MSRGHLAVVAARAGTLALELRHAIERARLLDAPLCVIPGSPIRSTIVAWEAQRLQSAIDKALTGRPRDPETGLR